MLHTAPARPWESIHTISGEFYTDQLKRGFNRLLFDLPLERQYREAVRQEQFQPALICCAVALIVWIGFAVSDLVRLDVIHQGVTANDFWVLLGARWSVLIMMLVFITTPLRNAIPVDRAALIIYSAIGLAVAISAAIYRSHGLPSADTAQIVVIMAAFLPLGLVFYAATAAALLLVVVTAIAGLVWLDASQLAAHMGLTLVMALAVPVGAVGAYLRENAHRRQFLLTAILARQAQFDPLTDLANRRLFQHHAEAAIGHASRNNEPVVLAVLDIDHFKRFNDQFGHALGDQALRLVADAIAAVARRPMDMAARLGGEEFALLLHGSDLKRATPILETLRSQIAALTIPTLPDTGSLTISIGATSLNGDESLEAIYDRADRLLYASKADGRDRLSAN